MRYCSDRSRTSVDEGMKEAAIRVTREAKEEVGELKVGG